MTKTTPLTSDELDWVLETIDAWGAVVDEVGSSDVAFTMASKRGFASLDEDSSVVAQVLLAPTFDAALTSRWIEDQALSENLWLELDEPDGGENDRDPFLWLCMD